MAFDDVQFPTDISRGSRGGPRFSTQVVRVESGAEVRNPRWDDPLFEFNAKYGVKRFSQLQAVHDFFIARRGQTFGFRYKNWLDYIASIQPVGLDSSALPNTLDAIINGSRLRQLQRLYTSGPRSYTKDIVKPISSLFTMRKDTVNFTQFSLNDATGVITLDLAAAEATKTIGTPTGSNPVQFTSFAHGLVTGDVIWIEGELTQTQWNRVPWSITFVDVDHFTIPSTFTSGSNTTTAYVFEQTPNFIHTFDWSGQFDLACRFGIDFLDPTLDGPDVGDIPSIPIQETRDFV